MIKVWTDGATAPTNPGPSGAGAWAERDGAVLFELSQPLSWRTNNHAEYKALVLALERLLELNEVDKLDIRCDSQLVVNQVNGTWRAKDPSLAGRVDQVRALLARFPKWRLRWLPREENARADKLSKAALKVGHAPPPAELAERCREDLKVIQSLLEEDLMGALHHATRLVDRLREALERERRGA